MSWVHCQCEFKHNFVMLYSLNLLDSGRRKYKIYNRTVVFTPKFTTRQFASYWQRQDNFVKYTYSQIICVFINMLAIGDNKYNVN